jgi:hypothetical protein
MRPPFLLALGRNKALFAQELIRPSLLSMPFRQRAHERPRQIEHRMVARKIGSSTADLELVFPSYRASLSLASAYAKASADKSE